MILQLNRTQTMHFIFGQTNVLRSTLDLHMVLYQNTVLNHRKITRSHLHPILIKNRRRENDVIALPLPWALTGVDQWNVLLVNRSTLTIGISNIVVIIENLNLVFFLEENTAVAPALACAIHHRMAYGIRGAAGTIQTSVWS